MISIDDLCGEITFNPYIVDGSFGKPSYDKPIELSAEDSYIFLEFLKGSKWGDLIVGEFQIQSLCERNDGDKIVQLLSALIPTDRFLDMVLDMGFYFRDMELSIKNWIDNGCNEVIVHFVDKRKASWLIMFPFKVFT